MAIKIIHKREPDINEEKVTAKRTKEQPIDEALSNMHREIASRKIENMKNIILNCIGSGAQGDVYLVLEYETRKLMVLKTFNQAKKHFLTNTFYEAKIFDMIKGFDADNQEQFLEVYATGFNEKDQYQIFMEYGCGDLHFYNIWREKNPFNAAEVKYIASTLVKLVRILRTRGIFHRDIKPKNMIVTRSGKIKLTDFSLSLISPEDVKNISPCGTINYMLPDVAKAIKANKKVSYNLYLNDLYAVGKTIQSLHVTAEAQAMRESIVNILCENLDLSSGDHKLFFDAETPLGWMSDWPEFESFMKEVYVRNMTDDQLLYCMQQHWQFALNQECLELGNIALKIKQEVKHPEMEAPLEEQKQKPLADLLILSQIYNQMALVHEALNNLDLALEFQNKALEAKNELFTRDPKYICPKHRNGDKSQTYNNIGNLYVKKNELEKAKLYYLEAIKHKLQRMNGNPTPDISLARYYNNLGMIFIKLGDLISAEENIAICLRMRESMKTSDLELSGSYLSLGTLQSKKKNYKDAQQNLERGLEMKRNVFGNNHPEVAKCLVSLGVLFYEQDMVYEALAYFEKAHGIFKNVFGPDHKDSLDAQNFIIQANEKLSAPREEKEMEQFSEAKTEETFSV